VQTLGQLLAPRPGLNFAAGPGIRFRRAGRNQRRGLLDWTLKGVVPVYTFFYRSTAITLSIVMLLPLTPQPSRVRRGERGP
jgi:hypothetical protein